MDTLSSVKAARRCGTPLIIIRTADPSATIRRIEASPAFSKPEALIQWDVVRGAMPLNDLSAGVLTRALQDANMEQSSTTNPTEFLTFSRSFPKFTIVFMLNLHRFCSDDIGCIQALWNLRDDFKSDSKTVIGLCPNITLPAELSQDVLILDEPLPTDAELRAIAEMTYTSAQLPQPDAETLERIVDATLGLAAFPAEQSMAMSITRKGMDIAELWSRKQSVVEQTPGLSVWRGGETFASIGGCTNVKDFLKSVIDGNDAPRAVIFIDEIEKSIGTGQDTSGVSAIHASGLS